LYEAVGIVTATSTFPLQYPLVAPFRNDGTIQEPPDMATPDYAGISVTKKQ
jgi:hypothetical protein